MTDEERQSIYAQARSEIRREYAINLSLALVAAVAGLLLLWWLVSGEWLRESRSKHLQ